MLNEHDWREVIRYDNCQGFLCNKCELFIKYHSTRPVYGCVEDYSTMSQQDIRRELSGTEFWNEYCSQANCKGDRN